MIKTKILPSTAKCFLDENIDGKEALSEISMLKNERLSFQLAYTADNIDCSPKASCELRIESALSPYIKASVIESVPVTMPAYPHYHDDNYLRTEPGLYPDLLIPFDTSLPVNVPYNQLRAVLFTVENKDGLEPGVYIIKISLVCGGSVSEAELKVTVIGAALPEQTLMHTQWFHNDCLATHYNVGIFSERHWEIIGNYMEAAVNCGVNMILTPVLTPPLDTCVGRYRPTVQLVDIERREGRYSFGYDKLDRYVRLALEKGIKFFEISHLFTQWGAAHAPKVMAETENGFERIFGWETDAGSDEYRFFIREFVSGLVAHLKTLGIDRQCAFHISDEPGISSLESYLRAKSTVADLLEGYKIFDALSDYAFYETGAVDCPIPASNAIGPFLEHKIPNLWTYYCCGQSRDVSNRFLAMPGSRTRVLGSQLYKFDIRGFLQWGFNFWYSQFSLHPVNPLTDTCGDYFSPAGDAMSVYPASDGSAYYSLHAVHFYEALQDQRALSLLESRLGRDRVVGLIDDEAGEPLTFSLCPRGDGFVLGLREKVNALLAE